MEIKKTFHKRQLAIAVILTAILVSSLTFSATWLYAGGALSSPGTTYGPGDVDVANYLIFKEGSTYYAKNGTTRIIDFSGSNGSAVVQNAVNALSSIGGTIVFKEGETYQLGNIELDSGSYGRLIIKGQGRQTTQIQGNVNGAPVFKYTGSRTGYFLEISDLTIKPIGGVSATPFIDFCNISDVVLRNLYLINCPSGYSIHLQNVFYWEIDNVLISGSTGAGGILADYQGAGQASNVGSIELLTLDDLTGTGIYINGSALINGHNIGFQSCTGTYGMVINATTQLIDLMSFTNLWFSDNAPTTSVLLLGSAGFSLSNIHFDTCAFGAPGGSVGIQLNFTESVHFTVPEFRGNAVTSMLVGANCVNTTLISPITQDATFITGKNYWTYNNGTYVVIP